MTGNNIGFLLRDYAKDKGVTVADLARCTGLNEKTVKNCFKGEFSTKLSTVGLIANSLRLKRIEHKLVD